MVYLLRAYWTVVSHVSSKSVPKLSSKEKYQQTLSSSSNWVELPTTLLIVDEQGNSFDQYSNYQTAVQQFYIIYLYTIYWFSRDQQMKTLKM